MADFSSHPKLQKFFATDKAALKRLRCVSGFLTTEAPPQHRQFFGRHFSDVYKAVLDTLSGKGASVDVQSACEALTVLCEMVRCIPTIIKKKWQVRSMGNLLQHLLKYEVARDVRLKALRILLRLIDTLQDAADASMRELVFLSIDLRPFATGSNAHVAEVYANSPLCGPSDFRFARASTRPSTTDSLTYLDSVLQFVTKETRDTSFPFWLDLVERDILPTLYAPLAVPSTPASPSTPPEERKHTTTYSFRPHCPPEVQGLVAAWVGCCMHVRTQNDVLFAEERHVRVVMEVFRQALELPPEFAGTTKHVIACYEDWVRGQGQGFMAANAQATLQSIVDQLASTLFYEPSTDKKVEEGKLQVCERVLDLFRKIPQIAPTVEDATWERLLVTLLNATNFVLSTSGELGVMERPLFHPLLDCLFDCFLAPNTQAQGTTLWEVLQERMRGWLGIEAAVSHWRARTLSLTKQLLVTLSEETAERHGDSSSEKEQEQEEEEETLPRFTEMFTAWDHFVQLIGDPMQMTNPVLRSVAVEGLVGIVSVLLDTAQLEPPVVSKMAKIKAAAKGEKLEAAWPARHWLPQASTLLQIFGPVLFDVCGSTQPELRHARVRAAAALCRIFVIRGGEPIDSFFTMSFYRFLHVTLDEHNQSKEGVVETDDESGGPEPDEQVTSGCAPAKSPLPEQLGECIAWAVLCECRNLFCVDLPGVHVVVPDFLRAIQRALRTPRAPTAVRDACFAILSSWLTLPYTANAATFKIPDLHTAPEMAALKRKRAEERISWENESHEPTNVKIEANNPLFGVGDLAQVVEELKDDDDDDPIATMSAEERSRVRASVTEASARSWGTLIDLKKAVLDVMFSLVGVRARAVWPLCVVATMEMRQDDACDEELVQRILKALVDCVSVVTARSKSVACTALEALRVLAHFQDAEAIMAAAAEQVLVGLCDHIVQLVAHIVESPRDPSVENRARVASDALYVVLDWVMLLAQPRHLLPCVFRAVEAGTTCMVRIASTNASTHTLKGLFGVAVDPSSADRPPTPDRQSSRSPPPSLSGAPPAATTMSSSAATPSSSSASSSVTGGTTSAASPSPPPPPPFMTACKGIQEAADAFTRVLVNWVHHFPSAELGAEQLCTDISEDDEKDATPIYAIYQGCTIVGAVRRKDGGVRLILRDKTGKYVWDLDELPPSRGPLLDSQRIVKVRRETNAAAARKEAQRLASNVPAVQEEEEEEKEKEEGKKDDAKTTGAFSQDEDLMLQIRRFIEERFAAQDMLSSYKSSSSRADENAKVKEMAARALEHHEKELKDDERPDEEDDQQQDVGDQELSSIDPVRALVSALYLGVDAPAFFGPTQRARCEERLTMLERNVKLDRSIRLLDSTPSRECHKIGLIYVAPGQDHQRALLRNETEDTSEAYRHFLDRIGDRVRVRNHKGFLGGLDPRSTGESSVYWCSAMAELMFHVVTLMPTDASDEQQIQKKRQVGNDHVHVLFSDHHRDYRPSTITSQFNDAHIVVYPLQTHPGTYRIQVFSKPGKVPPFGPLLDGMTVTEAVLAPLVRLTAMNANRSRRYATQGYGRPFPTRQKYINDIYVRHQVRPTEYLRALYESE